jgi:hypothetical protein
MKRRKIEIKQNDKLFVWSMYLVFGCLILFASVLGYRLVKSNRTDSTSPNNLVNVNMGEKIWMDYTSPEFQFSMDVPRLLTKRETRDQAGYRYFMILGENKIAKGKGVSLGVTDRSLDEEIEETKKGYDKNGGAVLEKETETEVGGEKGRQLSFKPKGDDKTLESRDVVIFSHNNLTFTIATTPEQIGHVVESFKWN